MGGFERLGRMAAGSALASANLVVETVHVGVRTAAEAIGSAAAAGDGVVPGAGVARRMARTVGREASEGARVARRQAAASLAWMSPNGGPRTEADRVSWNELAADTALGPLRSVLAASLSLSSESIRAAAGTRSGASALDVVLERLNGEPTRLALFDASERRDAFVAVATDSGAAAVRETFQLAEAAARLTFNDTRPMRQAIEAGLEEMRRLSSSADFQELLPAPMVSEQLLEHARLIVDRAPERFLEALEDSHDGGPPLATVVKAAWEDAPNLRVFLALYPRALALVGTDLGKLVVAGSISFSELEAFIEGRRRVSDS